MERKLLNVTDLSSYLYCARKFYLEKVIGLKQPPNKAMTEGLIRHKVLEEFSNKEENLVCTFRKITKKEILKEFNDLLEKCIEKIFKEDSTQIETFNINSEELKDKIIDSMQREILPRTNSIEEAINKGFLGKEIWENLEPKFVSEMFLISKDLGLKGRADRVLLSKNEIVPFELKTRVAEKVWPSDEIQITCYAMLLEKKYGLPVPKGILETGNVRHVIFIDDEKKKKVRNVIMEVQNALEGKNLQYPSSFNKCNSCSWKKECNELK